MILYFRDKHGDSREIARGLKSAEEAFPIINKFLNERNFKCYYIRTWIENGELWFDVGSHSEFFILSPEWADVDEKKGEKEMAKKVEEYSIPMSSFLDYEEECEVEVEEVKEEPKAEKKGFLAWLKGLFK